MIHKYKKIYQTQDDTVNENCIEWVAFGYNPPNGGCLNGIATFTFEYLDCNSDLQTFSIGAGCFDGAYELIVPICVKENSVTPTGLTDIIAIQYGNPC
jgi:hypothetical protein